jgi:short-subunit dehydrogenase
MAVAIVTGASSGIGLEISKMLVSQLYVVFGLARDFNKCDYQHENFFKIACDVSVPMSLEASITDILDRSPSINVLVNNAGVGYFGPHETLSSAELFEMVQTNLFAPLLLTKFLLRRLKESGGFVINIASAAALYPHRMGCAYSATKAGLLQFGESLFDEVRKASVKVCTICPDMTSDTKFYDRASFRYDTHKECHIDPSCIAEAVKSVLSQRDGTVQTLVVIKPGRVGIVHKGRSNEPKKNE